MASKYTVFNSELERYGQRFLKGLESVPAGLREPDERTRMRAVFLEQLLLFDHITVKAGREDLALYYLLREFDINGVEKLLERGLLNVVLWTPNMFTLQSPDNPDRLPPGTPPLMGSGYSTEDMDIERHLDNLLKHLPSLHRDRRRIFKRLAEPCFLVPDWRMSDDAARVTIQAYENNRQAPLGLPYVKASDELNKEERLRLLDLGDDVLETEVLARHGLRSYDRYAYFELTRTAIKEIEAALNVSENTSQILTIEKVAAVQPLVTQKNLSLEDILKLRHHPDVKQYRKWINEVSVDTDASDIAPAYISAVNGSNNVLASGGGKLLKTLAMFTIGNTVSAAIVGAAEIASQLGLTLFDSYLLESIIRGYNPRLFVERMKLEAASREG